MGIGNKFTFPDGQTISVARNRVLVEIINDYGSHQTKGGLYVAGPKHHGAPWRGRVLAVGKDVQDEYPEGAIAWFKDVKYRGFRYGGLECAAIEGDFIQGYSIDEE